MYAWFYRHRLGVSGSVLLLYAAIKSILELLGDIDFILSRWSDPGWVATMIEYIVDPPSWIFWPVVMLGLALIWWDARFNSPSTKADLNVDNEDFFTACGELSSVIYNARSEKRIAVGETPADLEKTKIGKEKIETYYLSFDPALPSGAGWQIDGMPNATPKTIQFRVQWFHTDKHSGRAVFGLFLTTSAIMNERLRKVGETEVETQKPDTLLWSEWSEESKIREADTSNMTALIFRSSSDSRDTLGDFAYITRIQFRLTY
jgi:hypothetical protein